MSDIEEPAELPLQGNDYQGINISSGAKAHLGNVFNIDPADPLSLLPLAANAPYNSFYRQSEPSCLTDTRVNLLQQIYDWADEKNGQDEQFIFWLSGLAGTGKSTISSTVARRCNEQKHLGASFFFSKGGGDVSHAGKFFTSLAVQLACAIPSLQTHIRKAVRNRNYIASLSLSEQWRQLVLGPLSELENKSRQTYILIIDAIDECNKEDEIRIVLNLLAEVRRTHKLRIFLTSRPEISIQRSFNQMPKIRHRDFILHNISSQLVDHDITLFLKANFKQIKDELYLEAEWPGNEVIRKLVRSAGSLFIWAATACRFVREGKKLAAYRLSLILKENPIDIGAADSSTDDSSDDSSTDGSAIKSLAITPDEHLNKLYTTVLENSTRAYRKQERKRLCEFLRKTLGGIILLLSPLPALSLASLLSVPGERIFQTLDDLHSILDIPTDTSRPLRLLHPSFRDFLLDEDRCSKSFYVKEKKLHKVIADGCIQLMSRTLKKNICEKHTPGSLSSQVESGDIEKYLPPEVQYACLYWVQHLQKSSSQVCDIEEAHRFLKAHLLHWLEALGWMGKVSEGIRAILSLEAYVLVDKSPNLHAFIHDAKRFALYNRSVIEQAPLQLYCSALIFAPRNSIVRGQFEDYIPDWIQLKPKVQANWNAALQTLEGHTGSIYSVAFSPDGQQVVSGSWDRTVRLWDVATGAALQTLKGHTKSVNSVAFSPDGQQVVSGSDDRTVRLWDASTGAALQTFKGHTNSIKSVAFSPDGQQVVSGSWDRTVRLWDASTGAALQTFKGHTNSIKSVAFSPDSKLLSTLQVSDHWIIEGDINILWLPPDYRTNNSITWNESLILCFPFGNILFFCFKKGKKLII